MAVVDFGLGSVGKLSHIISYLKNVEIRLDLNTPEPIRSQIAQSIDISEERSVNPPKLGVGLVINDPLAAERMSSSGKFVIYVDSLPYLWTVPTEVPSDVGTYCAQRFCGSLEKKSPLANREIEWVDHIVPSTPPRNRGGAGLVISIGGFRSPLLTEDVQDAYIRAVILPVLRAARAQSMKVSHVCGGVPDRWVSLLESESFGAYVGQLATREFQDLLASTDCLFTSPGSTTLLEASASNVPTVVLPPQNVSQVLNADFFTGRRPSYVYRWPDNVLDREEFERLRGCGELVALEYIHRCILNASDQMEEVLQDGISTLLASLRHEVEKLRLPAPKVGGAEQVARIIEQTLLTCGDVT